MSNSTHTKYALQFNPAAYQDLLSKSFLDTLDGADLLSFALSSPSGEWLIYQDGLEPIKADAKYIGSFQLFKTGYRAIVVRKLRNS